jgi:AraC-like DNA-binding protein
MSGTTVERHDSLLASWETAHRPAPAALAPHVLGYAGYKEFAPGGFRRLEPSNDEVHVIFSFGPECRVPERVRSFVAATDMRHAVVEHDGHQHGVELRLTPIGAHMLLGVPMDELTCRVVELDGLLGQEADELIERMHEAGTQPTSSAGTGTQPTSSAGTGWDGAFDVMNAWLLRRLADVQLPHPAIEHTWARLVRSHGSVPVSALVEETGWSRRHLAARFRKDVGLAPKPFARILRFRHAARELVRPDGRSLAEIALDCGYYDQAHLNRDFREFSGRSPTELMAARLPDGGFSD